MAGLLRAEMFIGKMNVGSLEMVRGYAYIKRIYFESSEVAIAFARKYEKEMLEYIDRIRAEVRVEPIVFSNEVK